MQHVQEKRSATLQADALRPLNVLAIAVAAISPTTSVFLVYGSGLTLAGTGIVWAFVIGAVIALCMALCYAEVGSAFPSAGGTYTIVRRALGPLWGGVAAVLFLELGLVSTAAILTAAAGYLNGLVHGGLPVNWTALAMMAAVTALSVGRISPASWVAGAMLLLELAVISVFTVCGFAHVSPGSHPFTAPVVAGATGALTPVGAGGLLAAVVPALFALNGYDSPLYFAEESRGTRRALPRTVLLAAGICVAFELLAVFAATFAVGNLGKVAADASPLSLIARQVMGPIGSTVLLAGVVVAMFDTALSANLTYARVYYAAARDGMLPGRLARFFGHVSAGSRVPVYAFAFLFVGNGLLCVFSSLNDLISFTGVSMVIIYLLVAVSALVCRVREGRLALTLRMPVWPLPPLVAIAGAIVVLTEQQTRDLCIAFGIALAALAGYVLVRRRLPAGRPAAGDRDPAGPPQRVADVAGESPEV